MSVLTAVSKADEMGSVAEALSYQWEWLRRALSYMDILRQRGDDMLAHERAGLPPVLDFEYEEVLHAKTFLRPSNYRLLRITGRRVSAADCSCPGARPVMIIDPRAGHGPGIGGFKQESEVGVALARGHPTYFVAFEPDPQPGQTLADVLHALRRFVEEVARRHPGPAPVVYGNCQGGWAAALLAATHDGLAGPTVMSGSPLSYWSGEEGVNPMRLAGGLMGGTWLTHLLADLGNGRFDGAWLAANFEALDPTNTLWEKDYRVFADPDGQRERFLAFERWWTGFYALSREEIVAIVENLFVGNRLEQGRLRICEACEADLTAIRNPLVIFASEGDNITPPQQALGWIPAVYATTAALKKARQRIVYLINPDVGHLGIFVSADIACREHQAIFDNLERIERLKPGLYEMKVLQPNARDLGCRSPKHSVRFEPRRVEDLPGVGRQRDAFERVRRLSEWNTAAYEAFLGPWVRASGNPVSAAMQKWLHPMRLSRWCFSGQINPWLLSLPWLLAVMPRLERGSATGNPWMQVETAASRSVALALRGWVRSRDAACERLFSAIYDSKP